MMNAVNLYLDTNVYLKFFHLNSDDIEELNKLLALIETGKVVLYLPEQTQNEYLRNRESKIADAMQKLRNAEINNQYPQMCKQYPQYETLRKILKEYDNVKKELLVQLTKDIDNRTLEADKIINKLFAKSRLIPTTSTLLNKAKIRFDLGNPPGKNNSYGDSLNWECLITTVEESILPDEMYFITDDSDYYSVYDKNKFKSFLLDEWKKRTNHQLKYFRMLSDFFKEKFPNVQFAVDLEKEISVRDLVNSGSFYSTHLAIRRLSKFNHFSNDQIEEMVTASIKNGQIFAISNDKDVHDFFYWLVGANSRQLNSDLVEEFYNLYSVEYDDYNDEDQYDDY